VPFEVWQFRMYHRYHIMTCIFLGTIGLLQTLATQEFQGSLGGLLLAVAIFAPLRHAAHYARNQVWAHLFMEYLALAIPVIRLTVDSFTVSENSFEPLEICLREYGLGILCPVAMSIVFSTLPVRLSFVIIANICYAARLATTINKLMIANNLNAAGDSIYVAWDIHVGSMLPVYVFAISLFANILSTRLGRSLFEHMAQLERAHRQEVLATEHAIRCEHRAHEAERQNAEERLQQRNKYLGAICHDFGTPVSVLQMLLLMMRKRVMRDLRRERQDAAEAEAAAEAELAKASANASPKDLAEEGAAMGDNIADRARQPEASASANEAARSLECFKDSARMLDLVRRASAGLELLEVTRQKAIAFSKLQAGGTLVPDRKPFEMAELMRKSASIARDTGKSDRVTVQTHTDADIPHVVQTDANWLFMILVNFASNSMKHTRQGSVTISAIRVGESLLRFEVSWLGISAPAMHTRHMCFPSERHVQLSHQISICSGERHWQRGARGVRAVAIPAVLLRLDGRHVGGEHRPGPLPLEAAGRDLGRQRGLSSKRGRRRHVLRGGANTAGHCSEGEGSDSKESP